jgi:hypothetical protein
MIYYFQLDPENVEALVALAIMDLRSNEGSPFLPLSCSGAPHIFNQFSCISF